MSVCPSDHHLDHLSSPCVYFSSFGSSVSHFRSFFINCVCAACWSFYPLGVSSSLHVNHHVWLHMSLFFFCLCVLSLGHSFVCDTRRFLLATLPECVLRKRIVYFLQRLTIFLHLRFVGPFSRSLHTFIGSVCA